MVPWTSEASRALGRGRQPIKLDIRPEKDYVLLEGSATETQQSTVFVRGHVVVTTSETTTPRSGIYIILQGRRSLVHTFPRRARASDPTPQRIHNDDIFLSKEQELFDPNTRERIKKITAGEMILPYTFELPGTISESIAGLGPNFVEYNLKAYLEKKMLSKKVEAREHLRIVRTLGPSTREELVDRSETIGRWDGKCSYKFGPTARAAIWGDHITIDFQLTPHNPKLVVGKIRLTLKERHKIKTRHRTPAQYSQEPDSKDGWWVSEVEVHRQIFEAPKIAHCADPDLQLDMYQTQFRFNLPTSLRECRQSVEDHPEIRIKHTLFYDIELLNPDGHISQINAHNDVRIYISEHRPLRGREGVADAMQTPSNEHLLEDLQEAPPTYNRHYLDEVFGDVEVEGFRTPGHHTPGGTYTPGHRAMSRSVSGNNPTALSSINTLAQHAHPEDLSERLNRLRDLEHPPSSHLREAESTEVSPHGSRSGSIAQSDAGEAAGSPPGQSGPPRVGSHSSLWNMQAVSRRPSYDTALRTPLRSSQGDVPPSYEDTISQPPSPKRGASRSD